MNLLPLVTAFFTFIFSKINESVRQSSGGQFSNIFQLIGHDLLSATANLVNSGNPLGALLGLIPGALGGISSAVGFLLDLFSSNASTNVNLAGINLNDLLNIFTEGASAVEDALKRFLNYALDTAKDAIENAIAEKASIAEKQTNVAFEHLTTCEYALEDVFEQIKNEAFGSEFSASLDLDRVLNDMQIDLSSDINELDLSFKDITDLFTFSFADEISATMEALPVTYYSDKLYTKLESNAIKSALMLSEDEAVEQVKMSLRVLQRAYTEALQELAGKIRSE